MRFLSPHFHSRNQSTESSSKPAYSEADIQKAISALKNNEFRSIRKAAVAFNVPNTTLRGRMSGRTSRSTAHESEQILSPAEEKTFARWVTHLTRTGFPASPALAIEMAEEIRRERVQLSKAVTITLRPIGENWLTRFKSRMPGIAGIWTRQIDAARFKSANHIVHLLSRSKKPASLFAYLAKV
jgi:hypothetical protein